MKINEMFYSIQGEGFFTGNAAVFIRLSGCNLKCPFCDTLHQQGTNISEEEIVEFTLKYPTKLVVITGGEPTLQLTESLVDKLKKAGKFVAVETNGTKELPSNVDWITLSPKTEYVGKGGEVVLKKVSEIKVVFDGQHKINTYGVQTQHYYIQPCDTGDDVKNAEIIDKCINFIKENPQWKLSLQTQKILKVQ